MRVWGELCGVWAIALAHPIYSAIASGPEALTSYGLRRPDLLVLIILVSFMGPLLLGLIELPARALFGEQARRKVHAALIGILLSLVLWQWLDGRDSGVILRWGLPIVFAALIAWGYLKAELVRNFALILSLATVVVIVSFGLSYPVKDEVLPHKAATGYPQIDSETPVVVVVFDELPLAAIERPNGSIDPRFPAFAELARKANWYPGALSAADQTTEAVPSILTGNDPYGSGGTTPPSPGLANYPDSLCRIAADGGYEVHAYEPITDLCAQTWDLGTRITATIRRAVGSDDPDSVVDLVPGDLEKTIARRLNSPFDLPWTEIGPGRREAFERFIGDLPSDNRSLSVLHSTLPHVQWMYLPDGRTYPGGQLAGLTLPATRQETNRDAQQMLVQLQFTDRELGRLIKKMKAQGTWEKSLFVVTADHGAGFQAEQSRRMINIVNAGWVASIPLFIKFPGQTEGQVIPGTVTSRDITPTILGQLGLVPDADLTGRDLSGKSRLPGQTSVEIAGTIGGDGSFDVAGIEKLRRRASLQLARTFGESLYAAGDHARLLGSRPSGLSEVAVTPSDPSLLADVDTEGTDLPAYYQASLDFPSDQSPGPLAIALNGRIVATTQPWRSSGTWYTGTMLPVDAFRDGANEVRVYEIGSGD